MGCVNYLCRIPSFIFTNMKITFPFILFFLCRCAIPGYANIATIDSDPLSNADDAAYLIRKEFFEKIERLNSPGSKANDFPFTTIDHTSSSLYEIKLPPESKLLVMFFDPECTTCLEIIAILKENKYISDLINKQQICLLAIYSGENMDSYLKVATEMPAEWIIGYDEGYIEESDTYYFEDSPAFYLLDSEKTVIKKEISLDELFIELNLAQ